MLPIKKVYIDTRHKTADSANHSDFTVVLPETVSLPEGAVVYVDSVCLPYSWYTITDNLNDKIYVWVNDGIANSFGYYIFKIEQGVYASTTLTAKIQLTFSTITQATLTVTYYAIRNEIQIQTNYANVNYKILSHQTLKLN